MLNEAMVHVIDDDEAVRQSLEFLLASRLRHAVAKAHLGNSAVISAQPAGERLTGAGMTRISPNNTGPSTSPATW
jgi:hypothetical protein